MFTDNSSVAARKQFIKSISSIGNGSIFAAKDKLIEQMEYAQDHGDVSMINACKSFLSAIDRELAARYETGLRGH